jgi:hypothetical protein
MRWPNPSHDWEHTKWISTRVDKTLRMPERTQHVSERTQNVYQHLLTKSIPARTEIPSQHKPFHTSEDTKCISTRAVTDYTKCISTRDDQTNPLPASTQEVTQRSMTNPKK